MIEVVAGWKTGRKAVRGAGLLACLALVGLAGCSPEVGSESWCDALEEQPKGDWTANEAADYAQHCVFRSDDD